eukprot:c6222_g1_i1.p1 GENE.c6222_g1_i1~~c6222_g1_i1.p1  ORF type:complete len:815 (+),score=182.58 c6222_g1_i1:28-2445(+)
MSEEDDLERPVDGTNPELFQHRQDGDLHRAAIADRSSIRSRISLSQNEPPVSTHLPPNLPPIPANEGDELDNPEDDARINNRIPEEPMSPKPDDLPHTTTVAEDLLPEVAAEKAHEIQNSSSDSESSDSEPHEPEHNKHELDSTIEEATPDVQKQPSDEDMDKAAAEGLAASGDGAEGPRMREGGSGGSAGAMRDESAQVMHDHYTTRQDLVEHDTFDPDEPRGPAQAEEEAEVVEGADLPKKCWEALAMKRHPEVLELRERLVPISRGVSYARLTEVGRTEVKETLSADKVLQLVMQHLSCMGYTSSRQALSTESGLAYQYAASNESYLVSHLCMAVEQTDKIHERVAVEDREDWKDAEMELPEHLRELGLTGSENESEMNVNTEPETPDTISRGPNQELKGGTLNQIVRAITSANDNLNDIRANTRACLLTYWSFTTAERLLQKVMDRFSIEPSAPGVTPVVTKEEVTQIQLRVLNIMKQWMSDYSYDFTDKMMHIVNAFVRNKVFPINKKWASSLEDIRNTRKKFEINLLQCPEPMVPRSICSPTLTWEDVSEEEIARQLSLLDFADYSAIRPIELLGLAWSKPHKRHRSPNVIRATMRFNFISVWTARQIMVERFRDRTRRMAKIMKLVQCLCKLNNLNCALAMIAALNEASVSRLKVTREEVANTTLQQFIAIEATLSPDKNYKAYREHLKTADPPCVPYLGVYLSDLTFMEEGNKDFLPNGHINFFKSQLVSRVISEVMLYQQKGYNFHPVPQIQNFFTLPDLSVDEFKKEMKLASDELYEKSLKYESRGADRRQIMQQ